jgi:hypothetical protein
VCGAVFPSESALAFVVRADRVGADRGFGAGVGVGHRTVGSDWRCHQHIGDQRDAERHVDNTGGVDDLNAFFEWQGPWPVSTPASVVPAGASVDVSSPVMYGPGQMAILSPGTTYQYRLVASSSAGTTYGSWRSFTTLPLVVMEAPSATTGSASAVTATSATLNAVINPGKGAGSYHFDYGSGNSYGARIPASEVPIGQPGDNTDHPVSQTVAGLTASTTYHFRIEATNPVGTSYGNDQTFTTPPAPSAPVNTEIPRITGAPSPGSRLTCSSGNWTGAVSYGYEWLRIAASSSDATSQTDDR